VRFTSPGSCGGAEDHRVVAKLEEEAKALAAGDAHGIELAEKARAEIEQRRDETSRGKAKGGTCRVQCTIV
jgi:hypothetical protein